MSATSRKLLRGANQNLIQQQAEAAEEKRLRAMQSLNVEKAEPRWDALRQRQLGALAQSITSKVLLTASAHGYNPNCEIRHSSVPHGITAYTDLKKLVVLFDQSWIPLDPFWKLYDSGDPNVSVQALKDFPGDMALAVEAILGASYHELAHIRFSPQLDRLVSERPEGWIYSEGLTRKVWNILEDQRIETAASVISPNLARFFTSCISMLDLRNDWTGVTSTTYSKIPYPFVAGRLYLPEDWRLASRGEFAKEQGEDRAQELEDIVWGFMQAPSLGEQFPWIERMIQFLADEPESSEQNSSSSDQGEQGEQGSQDEQSEQSEQDIDSLLNDFLDQAPMGNEQTTDNGFSSGAADEDLSNAAQEIENLFQNSDGKKLPALPEAPDYGEPDPSVESVISDATHATQQGSGQSTLPKNSGIGQNSVLSGEKLSEAESIAERLVQELTSAASKNAPRWREYTDHGSVNAFRYRTKARGDRNFYRQREGSVTLGFDMDVSVMLDHSGSMWSQEDNISIVGHAVKRACDELGVPCTVSLFETTCSLLYGIEDEPTGVRVSAGGGTDPLDALKDLDSQRTDDDRDHLVLIVTDGQFDRSVEMLAGADGRYFVGLGLGDNRVVSSLQSNGVPDSFLIDDVLSIPEILGDHILSLAIS